MPLKRERTRDGSPSAIHRFKPKERGLQYKGTPRKPKDFTELEVGLAKCLLWLGVSQTVIADMLGTYPKYISDIKLGRIFPHVVSLELWSRDVTGFLHERIMKEHLNETWDDVYAVYNGKRPDTPSGELEQKEPD